MFRERGIIFISKASLSGVFLLGALWLTGSAPVLAERADGLETRAEEVPAETLPETDEEDALGTDEPELLPEQVAPEALASETETAEPLAADELDGPVYEVSGFELIYQREHPNHPEPSELLEAEVVLTQLEEGLGRYRPEGPMRRFRLSELSEMAEADRRLHWSAIQHICQVLVWEFNRRGIVGVFVGPAASEIEPARGPEGQVIGGADRRPGERREMRLLIRTARVVEVRTLGFGERIPSDDRVNHRHHRWIAESSPVRPYVRPEVEQPVEPEEEGESEAESEASDRRDLIRRDELDDYVFRLNRHPGRRVDLAIAAGEDLEAGEAVLDYLIAENRPWSLMYQVSNTGTPATDRWRHRFGFQHTQLTGRDDILSLDYVTAGFQRAHAVIGSYETPLLGPAGPLRGEIYGSFTRFDASDVGQADERFVGETTSGGAELSLTVFQHDDFFVDTVGGARWDHTYVDNRTVSLSGRTNFLVPYLGLEAEQRREQSMFRGSLMFEASVPELANTDVEEATRLGRIDPDTRWVVMKWDISGSVFLEPLLNPRGWADAETPETSTLAHEVFGWVRGQYALNDRRLTPQYQRVAGGFHSVRGHPESAAAGDTAVLGTLEYRLHIPRLFPIQEQPGEVFGETFRFAPQQVYGRPDWNLMFRAFVDAAQTLQSDRRLFERDQTMVGTGVGVELQVRRNFQVRTDWGVALTDSDFGQRQVERGDNRFHFLATILY